VLTFAIILIRTIRKPPNPAEPYEEFLFAALAWMIAAFAFDWWMFAASATVSGESAWVGQLSFSHSRKSACQFSPGLGGKQSFAGGRTRTSSGTLTRLFRVGPPVGGLSLLSNS
jgi:hypothetical protein